jgi:hypothetical protein
MNLRPDLRKPLLIGWGILAGVVVVCLAVLWWLGDEGELPNQLTAAETDLQKLAGKVDLAQRISEQEKANATLVQTIERLKAETGLVVTAPFLVPPGHPQPGQYFNEQIAAVQDFCRPKAQGRSIAYQERLGFENTAKVPRDEDAPYLLTMLQLTRKAADVILSTPTPVESFRITQPLKQPMTTGPAGRPPLLREYPLRLEVRGKLTDLLWILHHLANREGPGDYPLIVRKWTIDSKNLSPTEKIQQLDAVYEIAAMQFLSPAERTAPKPGAGAASTPGKGL